MLVQEAWVNAAQAEEALVGLPVEGGTDYRGNPDKAIEYYEKASSIFPDTEFSKKYKARADKLRANKEQFVADQKAFYKPADVLPWTYPLAPGKKDPFGPQGPILPPLLPFTPKGDVPPAPTAPVIPPPLTPDPKSSAEPKKTPDAKLTPDPKVPADPNKSPDLKPPDPPKVADPKSK